MLPTYIFSLPWHIECKMRWQPGTEPGCIQSQRTDRQIGWMSIPLLAVDEQTNSQEDEEEEENARECNSRRCSKCTKCCRCRSCSCCSSRTTSKLQKLVAGYLKPGLLWFWWRCRSLWMKSLEWRAAYIPSVTCTEKQLITRLMMLSIDWWRFVTSKPFPGSTPSWYLDLKKREPIISETMLHWSRNVIVTLQCCFSFWSMINSLGFLPLSICLFVYFAALFWLQESMKHLLQGNIDRNVRTSKHATSQNQ